MSNQISIGIILFSLLGTATSVWLALGRAIAFSILFGICAGLVAVWLISGVQKNSNHYIDIRDTD